MKSPRSCSAIVMSLVTLSGKKTASCSFDVALKQKKYTQFSQQMNCTTYMHTPKSTSTEGRLQGAPNTHQNGEKKERGDVPAVLLDCSGGLRECFLKVNFFFFFCKRVNNEQVKERISVQLKK